MRVTPRDELALQHPDRVAVLTVDEHSRGTVHVIAGIAPALWRAAEGSTLAELTEAAIAAYGEPPIETRGQVSHPAEATVRAALDDLRAGGLLVMTWDDPEDAQNVHPHETGQE